MGLYFWLFEADCVGRCPTTRVPEVHTSGIVRTEQEEEEQEVAQQQQRLKHP